MAPKSRIPENQDAIRARLETIKKEFAEDTQSILAAITKIQPAELSKMLSGAKPITRTNLEKIEDGIGIRLEWLEKGEEPIQHPGGKAPKRPEPVKDGEKLKIFVKKTIGTSELARRLGVSKSTVSGYYTSSYVETSNKEEIIKALGVTESEVFGDQVAKSSGIFIKNIGIVNVEDIEVEIRYIPVSDRTGFDYHRFWSETPPLIPTYPVKRHQLKENYEQKRVIVIEIDGDTMEPLLRKGYKLTAYEVDRKDWPYVTGIVAVHYNEELVVKRIVRNDLMLQGHLVLTSDNPTGGSFPVPQGEIIMIWRLDELVGGKIQS